MLLFSPMPLGRRPRPFDHLDWLFELKYDGFRALAVLDYGQCTLYCRNGHPFASFAELATRIGNVLMPRSLVLDGEIVCLDERLTPLIYADHIEASGIALFEKCCELDLEGIVAKHKHAPYDPEQPTWFKIRNRNYSQMVGRKELFERERHREPVPGWHTCTLASAVATGI